MIWFCIGIILGANVGLLLAGLLSAASAGRGR